MVVAVGVVVAAVGLVGGYWDRIDHVAVDARHAAASAELRSADLETRIHGVKELEQVINGSPDDQPAMLTELSAFIRSAPDAGCRAGGVGRDVQAALSVLGRRRAGSDGAAVVDLHGTCLRRAQMADIGLVRAKLAGVDLSGAELTRAVLDGADLSGANLTGADLSYAHVVAANLTRANLDGARTEGLHIA